MNSSEALSPDDYTNYQQVKNSVDIYKNRDYDDLKKINDEGKTIPYRAVKLLDDAISQLDRKDVQEVIWTDDATGIKLISDSDNFTENLHLEIEMFNSNNWPFTDQSSWMGKIPSLAAEYAGYRIIIKDETGLITDTKKGFTVQVPISDKYEIDKVEFKASYGISPIIDGNNRTATFDFRQSFVPYVNGNTLFISQPLENVNPQNLDDGAYALADISESPTAPDNTGDGDNTNPDNNGGNGDNSSAPKTGDSTGSALAAVLMMISAAGEAVFAGKRKKETGEK